MLRLQKGKAFRLPRLGSDIFARLMKAKLKYDRKRGMFEITDNTDISSVINILKQALKDEVIFELNCIICSKSADCYECEYADVCDRSDVSSLCICKECMNRQDAYEHYKQAFIDMAKIKIQ